MPATTTMDPIAMDITTGVTIMPDTTTAPLTMEGITTDEASHSMTGERRSARRSPEVGSNTTQQLNTAAEVFVVLL